MQRLLYPFSFLISLSSILSVTAQELVSKLRKQHPIYDYTKTHLNNIDTIPGFNTLSKKLKIFGTIYESDGVTPANGVILYICQPDDYGNYHSKKINGKRMLRHKGCIKTDTNGRYTFYTFIPGTYWPSKTIQQIHGVIKTPDTDNIYAIAHFVFDNDPLLRKSCKRKIAKKGLSNVLKLEKQANGIFMAKRDIILQTTSQTF